MVSPWLACPLSPRHPGTHPTGHDATTVPERRLWAWSTGCQIADVWLTTSRFGVWNADAVIKKTVDQSGKGWFTGPWETDVPVALGYADAAVDDPHVHQSMHEIYLVARGTSIAVVDGQQVALQAGDLLLVEPGEAHTFVESSDDYLHFVVQAPFVAGDKRTV